MKPPIPLGTTLDNRYKIIEILGQGGFGRVYLAEHINGFGAKCAIKEFAPNAQYADVPKVKELFDRECRNLQKLEHPQIPRFKEVLSTKFGLHEYILLIQDFIEGQSYHQILTKRNPLSELEAVNFLHQILPVLTYIHKEGIIHRDISPDNIICRHRSGKSEPVLIDFGIIKILSNQYTQVNTIIGKKGYSPEEQMKGANVSESSDLYALAATVIFLVSKQQPGDFYDAYNGKFNLTKLSISTEFKTIIERMLSHKQLDRYQLSTDVINALSVLPASLNSQPASNPPPNPPISPISPISPSIYYLFQKADIWVRIKKDFKKPLIYIGGGVVILFTSIFILSAIFKAITGILGRPPSPTPATSSTTDSAKSSTTAQKSLTDRMKAVKLLNSEVNKVFHQKHPELNGRQLSNSQADRLLAKEWTQIAESLIAQRTR